MMDLFRSGQFWSAILMLSFLGCSGSGKQVSTPTAPAVPIPVARCTTEMVREYRDFTGRTAAESFVELRARVSGYLVDRPMSSVVPPSTPESRKAAEAADIVYVNSMQTGSNTERPRVTRREGEFVKKGDLLFLIDPAPYELAVQQATGSLDAALAQAQRFELDLQRIRELHDSNTVSQADFDQAVANLADVRGQIAALQAAKKRAELDLEFTRVVAPIDGLLGRSLVTNGNLINADSTILTTIVSIRPIHVYFNVDEQSLLEYRKRVRTGSVVSARDKPIEVRLGLSNEEGFPHKGIIDFVANISNVESGNTQLRATFENEDNDLSPGLFARIESPFSAEYEAVMIPTIAVAMDQQGKFAWVIEGDQPKRRAIETGEIRGDRTIIKAGLSKGEIIAVSGLQKIRPGVVIKPVPTKSIEAPVAVEGMSSQLNPRTDKSDEPTQPAANELKRTPSPMDGETR